MYTFKSPWLHGICMYMQGGVHAGGTQHVRSPFYCSPTNTITWYVFGERTMRRALLLLLLVCGSADRCLKQCSPTPQHAHFLHPVHVDREYLLQLCRCACCYSCWHSFTGGRDSNLATKVGAQESLWRHCTIHSTP